MMIPDWYQSLTLEERLRKDWPAICGILWARCMVLFFAITIASTCESQGETATTTSQTGHMVMGYPSRSLCRWWPWWLVGWQRGSPPDFLLPCCITGEVNTFSSQHLWLECLTSLASLGTITDDYSTAEQPSLVDESSYDVTFSHHVHACPEVLPDHESYRNPYVSIFSLIFLAILVLAMLSDIQTIHIYLPFPTHIHSSLTFIQVYPITSHQNCAISLFSSWLHIIESY